jgi:hypothetical protein
MNTTCVKIIKREELNKTKSLNSYEPYRQLGMTIEDSEIMDNLHAGIHHDPKLEKLEQRELAEWMSLIDEGTPNTIVRIPKSQEGTDPKSPLIIMEGESKLLISQVSVSLHLKKAARAR